jgi:response regulator RpfG family c-di-GMP phosphodiesterase
LAELEIDMRAQGGPGASGSLRSGAIELTETVFNMPTSRHCLLIVDDEPHVCDSVHDLLRREFRVLKANSAQEGCRIMQEEEVHIVMSDQRMPQVTGVELLTKLKVRYPHAIRMLFTGYADLESIIAAINQGHIFQFMKKPWQPEELQAAVRQAAAEFDRLEAAAHEREHLVGEVGALKERVTTLETEVRHLQQATANRPDRI